MCAPDPNRMARWQAKVEHRKKFTQWHSETLKYKNRATSYHRGIDRIAMGHSRAKSDLAQKTRWTIGKLREKQQENYIAYAQKQSVDEGGRSWRARNLDQNYKKLLSNQAQIEQTVNQVVGRNQDIINAGIDRQMQNKWAANREKLGVRPEYGAPIYMPPKDKAGQMWQNIQLGLQVASMFMPTGGAPKPTA